MPNNNELIHPPYPHFFLPILPPHSPIQPMIPRDFQERYLVGKKYISSEGKVILRSATYFGKLWTLKLNNFKFQDDGWIDFYHSHNLNFGYILVFRYEGGNVFHVTIFDTSACYIHDNENVYDHGHEVHDDNEDEDDHGDNNDDGGEEEKEEDENSFRTFDDDDWPFYDHVKMEKKKKKKKKSTKTIEDGYSSFEDHIKMGKIKKSGKKKATHYDTKGKSKETFNEGEGVFSKGSDHPHFVATIQHHQQEIPRKFAQLHIDRSIDNFVIRSGSGKAWVVAQGFWKSSGKAFLGRGWSDYCIANGLNDGDVCLFKLIPSQKHEGLMEFKVNLL